MFWKDRKHGHPTVVAMKDPSASGSRLRNDMVRV
jgi:hypothetical protein